MNIKMTKDINSANCITHAGTFHADEIFATIILSKILKEVVLVRVNEVLKVKENQYVYDIGGGKFDHHQLGGNGQRENGIKYSSCGLIWKEFGKEVLKKYYIVDVDELWEIIDRDFITYIDANDNGQTPKIISDYNFLHLSKIIATFNPTWNEDEKPDKMFMEALKFANIVFDRMLKSTISKFKAKSFVEEAIKNSCDGVMVLDRFMPWKEFLIHSQDEKSKDINFVVFPSNRVGYTVYTVPKELNSFETRKPFPNEWAGLKDELLQEKTGVATARFCHNACFICTADTKEDAIKLANIANNLTC